MNSNGRTSTPRSTPALIFHVQNYMTTHESRMFGDLPDGEEYVVEPADVKLFPYHPDTPTFRKKYAQYLTLQTKVDAQMGELIDQLEADGLLDDTFIFHYGDHGGVLPGSKGYAHNDGLQVAMMVYVPKNWKHLAPAARGARVDGVVEFVDLAPTVLNLAGVEIPAEMGGRPFLGKGVTLEELNTRDTAFGYAERFDEKYDMVRFLRKGDFTYWRSYQPFNFDGLYNEYRYKQPAFREWRELAGTGSLKPEQQQFYEARPPEMLFDLSSDPHEVNNLAADPAYADKLVEMRRLLQQKVKSLPDVGFFPEPVFLKESGGDGKTFGQKHKAEIAKLIDIADLQMKPLPEAEPEILQALNSEVPTERYWGLITCSVFGRQAADFYKKAKQLATNDPDRLVRLRAAEFLGLTGTVDPMPYIFEALEQSDDPVEANLILNTVVLLRDVAGVEVDGEKLKTFRRADAGRYVSQRIDYLVGNDRLEKRESADHK